MRFLPVVMVAALAFGGCESIFHPKPPAVQLGRWKSVSMTGEGTRGKSLTVRLEPDGRFFVNEMQKGSDIPHAIVGQWTKVSPERIEMHPFDGSETMYLISEEDGVYFRTSIETAKMKKAPM